MLQGLVWGALTLACRPIILGRHLCVLWPVTFPERGSVEVSSQSFIPVPVSTGDFNKVACGWIFFTFNTAPLPDERGSRRHTLHWRRFERTLLSFISTQSMARCRPVLSWAGSRSVVDIPLELSHWEGKFLQKYEGLCPCKIPLKLQADYFISSAFLTRIGLVRKRSSLSAISFLHTQ